MMDVGDHGLVVFFDDDANKNQSLPVYTHSVGGFPAEKVNATKPTLTLTFHTKKEMTLTFQYDPHSALVTRRIVSPAHSHCVLLHELAPCALLRDEGAVQWVFVGQVPKHYRKENIVWLLKLRTGVHVLKVKTHWDQGHTGCFHVCCRAEDVPALLRANGKVFCSTKYILHNDAWSDVDLQAASEAERNKNSGHQLPKHSLVLELSKNRTGHAKNCPDQLHDTNNGTKLARKERRS